MKTQFLTLTFSFIIFQSLAQNDLPFKEIPPYSDEVTAGTVMGRMIAGLGYRYYWVTDGLRSEDLDYRPTEESKSTNETLEHIYDLSTMVLNAFENKPNIRPNNIEYAEYTQLRINTLNNLSKAYELACTLNNNQIAQLKVTFQRGEQISEYPIWNALNGPLSDALYHTGQVVSFRRTSGNPVQKGVNVFIGKTK